MFLLLLLEYYLNFGKYIKNFAKLLMGIVDVLWNDRLHGFGALW